VFLNEEIPCLVIYRKVYIKSKEILSNFSIISIVNLGKALSFVRHLITVLIINSYRIAYEFYFSQCSFIMNVLVSLSESDIK
jgi:hypothetical protein